MKFVSFVLQWIAPATVFMQQNTITTTQRICWEVPMCFFSLLQRSLSEILHGIQGVCCNKFKTKHQDAHNAAITISLQLREVKLSSSSSVIPSIAPTPIPVFLASSCHHHLTAVQSTAPAVERGQTVSSSSFPVTFPPRLPTLLFPSLPCFFFFTWRLPFSKTTLHSPCLPPVPLRHCRNLRAAFWKRLHPFNPANFTGGH